MPQECHNQTVTLQHHTDSAITVTLPFEMAEHEISRVMAYKTRLLYPTYVDRLHDEPPERFNQAVEQLFKKYGVQTA